MRAGALLGLVIAAVLDGCAPPAHVAIEITAPADVQRVELYVAPDRCSEDERVTVDCETRLAWDTAPRKIEGETFILDGSRVSVAERTGDGTFGIELKPDPERPREKIERILLVGYADAAGTSAPVAAAMLDPIEMPTVAEHWRIELGDVTPMPADPDTPPQTDLQRLRIWSNEADSPHRCVVMERWIAGGTEVRRDFLVPHEDTDCDDTPVECDPFWFDAPSPVRPAGEATCAAPSRLPGATTDTCQLGALTCSESTASGEACTPVTPTYCLADAFCNPNCLLAGTDCFLQLGLAHIYCDVYTDAEGAACPYAPPAFLRLSDLAASPLADCGLPLFGSFEVPFMGLSNPGKVGPITLTASDTASGSQTCSADITFSGIVGANTQAYGIAKIPLPNGTSSIVGVVVDVHVNGCTLNLQPSCYLVMQDGDSASHCGPYVPAP